MRQRTILKLSALVFLLTFALLHPLCEAKAGYVGFTFSPDGSYLLARYLDGKSSFIYRIEIPSGKATRLTAAKDGFEGLPSFSPDGRHIAYLFSSGKGTGSRLFIANTDGSEPHPLTNSETTPVDAILSPDGAHIVFRQYGYFGHYSPIARSAPHEWDFYMADLDGNNVRQLTDDSFYMVSPASLSPDGKTLLFVDSFEEIVIYPLGDGSMQKDGLKPILKGKTADVYSEAIFSSDGKSILFTASFTSNFWGRYNYNVYRLDLETHVVEPLTTEKGQDSTLAVSRDGHWVVFTHEEYKHESTTVFLLNLRTNKLMPLTITGIP